MSGPFTEKLSAAMDLPGEVLGAGRLSLLGQEQLTAVNHRGILLYESNRIVLRMPEGALRLDGEGLTLTQLDEELLRIAGRVTALVWEKEDEDAR